MTLQNTAGYHTIVFEQTQFATTHQVEMANICRHHSYWTINTSKHDKTFVDTTLIGQYMPIYDRHLSTLLTGQSMPKFNYKTSKLISQKIQLNQIVAVYVVTLRSCKWILKFQRNMLPPSSWLTCGKLHKWAARKLHKKSVE
jgi:hypothetical protein